jgi:3-phenylpropionate/trans-cinnamate dioxygenase ferredoxin reductase subunit
MAGRVRPDDDMTIVTGSIEERRFAAVYGREGRFVGVLGFNRPRHVMQYKTLLEEGASYQDAIEAGI